MKFFIGLTKPMFFVAIFSLIIACSEDNSTNPSNNVTNLKYAGNLEFDNATVYQGYDSTYYNYGISVKLYLDSFGTCYYQEGLPTGYYRTFDGKWKYENNSIIVTDDSNKTYKMEIISFNEDLYELPEYKLSFKAGRIWDGQESEIKFNLYEQLWRNFDSKLTGLWRLSSMSKKYPDGNTEDINPNDLPHFSHTINIGQSGSFREDSLVLGSTVIFTGDCDVWRGRLVFHNDNDIKIGPYSVNDSLLNYKNRVFEDGKEVIISYTFNKK